jgi:hypothetical protein
MDTATKPEVLAMLWNKGKLLGQKPPLKLKEIWAVRIRLQLAHRAAGHRQQVSRMRSGCAPLPARS